MKKKLITTRLEPHLLGKVEALAKKKHIAKGTVIRQIVRDYFDIKIDRTQKETLETISNFIPDLLSQRQALLEQSRTLKTFLDSCDEAFDNIADMKRGEGFYFKQIYNTLKEQQKSLELAFPKEEPKKEIDTKAIYEKLDSKWSNGL